MPKLTKKSFEKAKLLIQYFQEQACELPVEISVILNSGAATSWLRLQDLARTIVFPTRKTVGKKLTRKKVR